MDGLCSVDMLRFSHARHIVGAILRGGVSSGNASERCAGDEASAGRIIVVEQTADHLAAAEQTADGSPVGADHLRILVHLEAAKREGDAAGGAVGIIRRL